MRKTRESVKSEVRRLWGEGWSGKDLAARFRLAKSTVSAIVAGMPRPLRFAGPEDDVRVATPSPLPCPCPAPVPVPAPRRHQFPAPAVPPDPADRLFPEPPRRGSECGRAKLDEPKVSEMRRLRAEGWSTGRLARRFNVGRNTICYAINGTTWGHVPGAITAKGGPSC